MALTARGMGRPDFSLNVGRAITRKGITLQYSEATKMFARSYISTDEWQTSAYPGVGVALDPGESDHLIDFGTGLALPFTVPQGYILGIKYYSFSSAGIFSVSQYLDNMIVQNAFMRNLEIYYEQEIFAVGTDLIDPAGLTSHIYDFKVTNLGTEPLCAIFGVVGILKAVGTEPLTTKTVGCKLCDKTATVPYNTTKWACPNGHKNIYYNLPFGGSE